MRTSASPIWFVCGWAIPAPFLQAVFNAHMEGIPVLVLGWDELMQEPLAERLRREPEPVRLGGWSLGGLLALEAAVACPGKVRDLCLISSTACFCSDDPQAGVPVKQVRAMRGMLRRRPTEVLERFYDDCAAPYPVSGQRKKEWMDYWREKDPDGTLLCRGLVLLEQMDFRPLLGALKIPVQLIHGRQDRIIPPGAARLLAARTRASLNELDGGHDLILRKAFVGPVVQILNPGLS